MRWLFAIPLLVACGDVRSGSSFGDPIWMMQADLQGVALGDPEGEYRALFGWVSYGEGDLFDCYDETVWWLCGQRISFQQQLQLGPTELFPVVDGLMVPFFELPREEELLSRKGSVLALGGLAIYDDRNLNGELDPINSTDPIDELVAESISPPDLRSLAVYREGPVHSFWEIFRDLLGCPDPPLGFSVARVMLEGNEVRECQVTPDTHLLISDSTNADTARIQCALKNEGLPLNTLVRPDVPMPLPENAVVQCNGPKELQFYVDEGEFCDRFDTTIYRVRPNQTAPEWWPCTP
jgi:hypothetical protein